MNAESHRQPISVQILQHGRLRAADIALESNTRKISFQDLSLAAIQVAEYINTQDLEPKSSIALSIKDPLQLIAAFIGVRLCGHNALVINIDWPHAMQSRCIEQLQPALSLNSTHMEKTSADEARPQGNLLDTWISSADRDLESAFYTGFTSGSEGDPKGFSRHENSWLHSFETDAEIYRLSANDTVVCPGKLAHSLFLYATLRALTSGSRVLFLDGLTHASQRAKLQSIDPLVLFAVPAQLQSLVDAQQEFPALRLVISAGAKLQPLQRVALGKALPKAELIECYGSSELSYIALAVSSDNPPANSVGKLCSGVELRIVSDDTEDSQTHQSGRLLIRSPLRFIGYAEANNQTSLRQMECTDGFLDSGDTGYLDESGFLFITGRSDRMMLIGGHSVFPEQLEAALLSHPAVLQAAVFPVADERRGQRPVAAIALHPESQLSRRELTTHCATTLPKFSIPKSFYLAENWPRTVSDKTDLKQLIAGYDSDDLEIIE